MSKCVEIEKPVRYFDEIMVQEKLAKISLNLFGNSLGIGINVPYWIHHRVCRWQSGKSFAGNEKFALKAQELREKGFVKLGRLEVSSFASRVKRYFETHPCKDGMGYVARVDAKEFVEDVSEFLNNPMFDAIREYYGSEFQNYWITIMRYETTKADKSATSFDFHLDDNPRELLKIFIYLNDTTAKNGAFRTFDYNATKSLIQRGFISSTPELRTKSQALISSEMIERDLNVLEGEAGTVLVFDNNLIHKGTVPEISYRDIVCVEIYPSAKPISQESVEKGLTREFFVDYPKNPFFNDLLDS